MTYKNIAYTIGLTLIIAFSSQSIFAQGLVIPRGSPKASISQFIGVCNVLVEYGRPSVRGRKILGDLIPYDTVWRVGANEATTISFNHSITIQGNEIPPGEYGLFMIPRKNKWVVILNNDAQQWGAYNYNKEDDIIRVELTQEKSDFTEMCTFSFVDVNKTSGILRLQWDNFKIDITITTETHNQTLREIELITNTVKENWYNYSAAAQFHFYELKEVEKALKLIDVAIVLEAPNPSPWMLKSQILAYQKKYKEAIKYAQEAIIVSKKYNLLHEVEENEEKIKTWRKL